MLAPFAIPIRLPVADRAKAVLAGITTTTRWGRQGHDGSVVIVLGGDRAELEKLYQEVTVAGHLDNPLAMPYETDLPIHVLRGPKAPFDWSRVKHYD